MSVDTKDFTFRMETSGSVALATDAEHVLNTVQRLLYEIPGQDDYETNRGLNIRSRLREPYTNGDRDTEFEENFINQLNKYTDIRPQTIMAVYVEDVLAIIGEVEYNSKIYRLQLSSDPDKLAFAIEPKVV